MRRSKRIGICCLILGILLLLFSLPAEIFFAILAILLITVGVGLLCSSK